MVVESLDRKTQIEFKNYTTKFIHTSPEAYQIFDEIINSTVLDKKDEFYLKESLTELDKLLEYRKESQRTGKINQQDYFQMEQAGKKYMKFMENVRVSEHFDNSFIYKYISEVYETLQYEKVIDENVKNAIKFLMDKLKLTTAQANKIVQKAAEKKIDLLKIQQKWSILAPTLMSIVAEYEPMEK